MRLGVHFGAGWGSGPGQVMNAKAMTGGMAPELLGTKPALRVGTSTEEGAQMPLGDG